MTPSNRAGIVDQDPLALGQDRVVGGVPRDPEALGDPGDGQVLAHERLQRPPQPAPRQLRPRLAPPGWCPGATRARSRCTGSGGPSPAASWVATRTARAPARRTTLSRGTPSQPQRRHHWSGSTTRQASTARSGSSRWPVTSRPSSSRRQNVVRSGRRSEPVASGTSRSSGWAV